jgi:hypothetical protein
LLEETSRWAYTLVPSPIPTHQVTILSFPILKVSVGCEVDAGGELMICEDMMDDFSGVTKPELVFGHHPFGYRTVLREEPLIVS